MKRLNICATKLATESEVDSQLKYVQFDLFSDVEEQNKNIDNAIADELEERRLQRVLLNIKEKYGKNAILKGMNLEEGSTAIERNRQIGGHHE